MTIQHIDNQLPNNFPQTIACAVLWEWVPVTSDSFRARRRAVITAGSRYAHRNLNINLDTVEAREQVATEIARGWLRHGERPAGTYYTLEHLPHIPG